MVLGKPGAPYERLLPDRTAQPLRQRGDREPAVHAVGARAHDQRRRPSLGDHRGELGHVVGRHRARPQHLGWRSGRGVLVGRLEPVAHRHDDERRAGREHRLVVCARDRAGDVLGAGRQVAPDRILAGQPLELSAGEERLERELAAVLLADHDDQRRANVACVDDRVDRVAKPGRGVEVHERRLAARERVARGDADDRALVQAEHEPDVVGQVGEERDLSRPRVAEDGGETEAAHGLKGRVTDGRHRAQTY